MNKRGAYFFVLDAFIAVSIIIATLVIIFSAQSIKVEKKPALSMAQDFMAYFANTKIRDYQGEYVYNLTIDGNITNADNTLLDQLIEFYYLNKTNPARRTDLIITKYLRETSSAVISGARSTMIYIQDKDGKTLLFNSTKSTADNSNLMVSLEKIAFKSINETFVYGPVIFEVKLWV
jgi:hypothetical protein